MKKYSLYILTIVSLLISCTDSKEDYISPNKGKEVAFSVSVENGNHKSRTVYGSEIKSEDGSSVVVNWVDGDKITVYAPDCSVKQANYSIVTGGKEQNYANDLVKEGAAGIQWGTSEGSAFYAIYPAVEGTFSENDNGYTAVETQISPIQYVDFGTEAVNGTETNPGTWVGTPYNVGQEGENMPNALMYAYSSYESSMDEKGNPREVNLRFKPYSTVLKFTLNGWEAGSLMGDYHSGTKVEVKKLILEAPYTIAGKCLVEFPENNDGNPTVTSNESDEAASSIIEVYPKKNVLLGEGEKLEFSIFAIPQEYTMDATDYWTVSLETNYGVFTYKMIPSVDSENTELISGQIHKITIPALEINTGAVKLDAKQWIKYIPRNVYLSELSMPGAWYATNSDYQGSATLSDMYTKGVRAFNIDCRMTATADSWEQKSVLGVKWYELKDNPTYKLQCAGSETFKGAHLDLGFLGDMDAVTEVGDGKTVESQLELLSEYISESEFVMVVLTLAEKPKDLSGFISGSSETFGNNVDPSIVLAEIKDILDRRGKELNVFGYRDIDVDAEGKRKTLNANTTVNDVLGSMVIKVNVNVDQDETELADYGMSNVLLSEGSMASESKYISSPIVAGSFTGMNTAELYWGASKTNPSLTYYYHQAQLTTSSTTASSSSTTPSLKDRMDAVDDIIKKSASIYAENKHNGLFQLGIGGYIDNNGEDRTTVANTLNKHVLDQVKNKLNTSPSPIGIVLMNYCTDNTYKSLDLVNAIIEMNTRFYLNRNIDQLEWPDGKNPWDTVAPPSTEDGDGDLGNS